MFKIYPSPDELQRLQDLALPHAFDKILRDAAKLNLRLGIDVYFYYFSGHRAIRQSSSIDFLGEKIEFFVMEDSRIAIKGAE